MIVGKGNWFLWLWFLWILATCEYVWDCFLESVNCHIVFTIVTFYYLLLLTNGHDLSLVLLVQFSHHFRSQAIVVVRGDRVELIFIYPFLTDTRMSQEQNRFFERTQHIKYNTHASFAIQKIAPSLEFILKVLCTVGNFLQVFDTFAMRIVISSFKTCPMSNVQC